MLQHRREGLAGEGSSKAPQAVSKARSCRHRASLGRCGLYQLGCLKSDVSGTQRVVELHYRIGKERPGMDEGSQGRGMYMKDE
jgi:hypothetical protein